MTLKEKKIKVSIRQKLERIFPKEIKVSEDFIEKVFGTTIAILKGDNRCKEYLTFASDSIIIFSIPINEEYCININCLFNEENIKPSILYGLSSNKINLKVG